jgi:hypothetical protein
MTTPRRIALDEEFLRAALTECIAYCGERAVLAPADVDVISALRSDALREPALRCLPPAYRADAPKGASFHHEMPMSDAFGEFLGARRRLLANEARPAFPVEQELRRSHSLVAADWRCQVWECAAMEATDCYFDMNDLPPWDTWLALADNPWRQEDDRVIVCWVPRWAEDLVDAGLRVLPFDNVSWIERRGGEFLVHG